MAWFICPECVSEIACVLCECGAQPTPDTWVFNSVSDANMYRTYLRDMATRCWLAREAASAMAEHASEMAEYQQARTALQEQFEKDEAGGDPATIATLKREIKYRTGLLEILEDEEYARQMWEPMRQCARAHRLVAQGTPRLDEAAAIIGDKGAEDGSEALAHQNFAPPEWLFAWRGDAELLPEGTTCCLDGGGDMELEATYAAIIGIESEDVFQRIVAQLGDDAHYIMGHATSPYAILEAPSAAAFEAVMAKLGTLARVVRCHTEYTAPCATMPVAGMRTCLRDSVHGPDCNCRGTAVDTVHCNVCLVHTEMPAQFHYQVRGYTDKLCWSPSTCTATWDWTWPCGQLDPRLIECRNEMNRRAQRLARALQTGDVACIDAALAQMPVRYAPSCLGPFWCT